MASRNIADLNARLRSMYVRFDASMHEAGIDFIVTCTYRGNDEQQALFNQGRKTKGKIVTNALPGQSEHNATDENGKPSSNAFDIALMNHGKINWDDKNPDWKRAGAIAKKIGLEWGGYWKFVDLPHFQLPKE